MAVGLIGKKLGMTQIFLEDGRWEPVTAVQAGPCTVTQVKTQERDGYQAVQVGFEPKKRASKPEKGHLKGAGPFRLLREFRIGGDEKIEVGQKLDVTVFSPGDLVDVTGQSRGMGFQGGVKRYHFRGGPKTHGQSDRHRAPGSVGSNTQPGHVLKGLRMAGHMGDVRVTTQNLTVVRVQPEQNVILIRGAVPGARNSFVVVRPAVKAKKKQ